MRGDTSRSSRSVCPQPTTPPDCSAAQLERGFLFFFRFSRTLISQCSGTAMSLARAAPRSADARCAASVLLPASLGAVLSMCDARRGGQFHDFIGTEQLDDAAPALFKSYEHLMQTCMTADEDDTGVLELDAFAEAMRAARIEAKFVDIVTSLLKDEMTFKVKCCSALHARDCFSRRGCARMLGACAASSEGLGSGVCRVDGCVTEAVTGECVRACRGCRG